MALLSNDFPVAAPLTRALSAVSQMLESFRAARNAANAYEELSALSDSQLAARGLERGDIARYVGARHLDI